MSMPLVDDRDGSLRKLAECALAHFREHAFERLSASFGYAVALGREPGAALRDDSGEVIAELDGRDADWRQRPVDVWIERLGEGTTGVVATLDCRLAQGSAQGLSILQLVVTREGGRSWLTLEGVGDAG